MEESVRTDQPLVNVSPRRIGRFKVTIDFLDLEDLGIRTLMRDVIVVDARANWAERVLEYHALSDHFDLIEYGQQIPEYQVTITKIDEKSPVIVEWKRVVAP